MSTSATTFRCTTASKWRTYSGAWCVLYLILTLVLYRNRQVSHTLSHLYWAIIVFMLLITVSTGQVMFKRVKTVVAIVKQAVNAAQDEKEKKD